MLTTVTCPSCRSTAQVEAGPNSRPFTCPECGRRLLIPAGAPVARSPAPASRPVSRPAPRRAATRPSLLQELLPRTALGHAVLWGSLGSIVLFFVLLVFWALLPTGTPVPSAASETRVAKRAPVEPPPPPRLGPVPVAGGAKLESQQVYRRLLKSATLIEIPGWRGSGALVNGDERLVITNYHVVHMNGKTAREVVCCFPAVDADGRAIAEIGHYAAAVRADPAGHRAQVLAVEPARDLALLRVNRLPAGVQPLPLARASAEPGQPVHSIGNPGGSDALWVYTSGSVRTGPYRKRWQASGGADVFSLDAIIIESQSPINPGDSGGPLVNDAAELVAVTEGSNRKANSINFFIDVSEVKRFLRAEGHTWIDGAR